MRVLIVKTSSMGDVVHALPVVHDILSAHPGAQIDWLVEEAYADIVRAHPGVRRVIPLALRRWRKGFWRADVRREWREWKAGLRAETYDAVIDLQGLVKSALIARLARGPLYGLSWASAREALAPLFYRHRQKTSLHRTEAAVPRYRALVAWALGYAPEGKPRYGLSLQAKCPEWLPGEASYVMLLSATAKDRKLWDEARWIALGQALAAQDRACVFAWGNAAERERAERLAAAVRAGDGAAAAAAQAAPSAFGLAEWMRVLRGASAVVGVDTGLLYLAAAVGTPAVAIYTGSSPHSVEFESAGPWRSLGDSGQQPAVDAVWQATQAVLAESHRPRG
ncbi:lipopolysaccharide heptosyltransferase I [Thiomonas bhubaneswarensis]|nr:lipopolysaccharide heptosyltransferase I [Thiomonas bhubaneswarensis]